MQRTSHALLLVILVTGFGCSAEPSSLNLEAERLALLDTDRAWAAAAAEGDVETVATFWAEDAANYFPGAPVARGRDEILALVQRNRSRPGFSLTWTPNEAVLARSGDLGYTSGTFRMQTGDASGAVSAQTGHYVCIWKRLDNGLWKCAVETSIFGPPDA